MRFRYISLLQTLFFSLILSASFIAHAADSARPEVGKYVKAYQGQENVKVWTLRIGPLSTKEVLFQIGGVDHEWDMKIFKAKIESGSNNSEKYLLKVDGKDYAALVLNGSYGELYLPGSSKSYRVSYSKNLSEESNAEHFLTDYLAQAVKK